MVLKAGPMVKGGLVVECSVMCSSSEALWALLGELWVYRALSLLRVHASKCLRGLVLQSLSFRLCGS